jgi:hypothetical protein
LHAGYWCMPAAEKRGLAPASRVRPRLR